MNALVTAAWQCTCDEPSDKLVLVYLADRANATRRAWPHLPTISRQTGLCKRTIMRSIDRLESQSHLTVSRKQGCSNSYTVHPKTDAPASDTKSPVTPRHPTGDIKSPLPVTPSHQQPNRNGTIREAAASSPLSKLQGWQLRKDLKETTDPAERAAIKAEIKRRSRQPEPPTPPCRPKPKPPADALQPSPELAAKFRAQATAAIAATKP